ncbi:MAG: flagellar export protein FliJ [Ruminiclostridium sp.]|nr:flagellar export protein FliJ [Ruminiclostridium sp.]
MPAFHFRLQTILNIKIQLEKSTKNELGVAIQKLEHQKRLLAEIRAEAAEQEEAYRTESTEGVILAKLKQRMEYISLLHQKDIMQQQRVNEEIKNVDIVREKLIEIMKDRKVLEKLKEKEFAEYRKEQEKAGQLLVDELISFKESNRPVDDKA